MRLFFAAMIALALLVPHPAFALDQADLIKKIEDLTRELDKVKQQMQEIQKKDDVKEQRITKVEKKTDEAKKPSWLEIGGDYRFRLDSLKGDVHDYMQYDPTTQYGPLPSPIPGVAMYTYSRPVSSYEPKNDTLMTNRFGLNLRARATEDITVKARLLMYKTFGGSDSSAVSDQFFSPEKSGVFDGNVSHIPQDSVLRVDQAFATWSNIANQPIWFSVGRRPSTGGVPSNLRQNREYSGNSGVPALLVDYAFDGMTLGVAPDIDILPGAYAKLFYGRGFDSGMRPMNNGLKDTDLIGLNVVPYDTENLRVELQWNRAFNMMSNPPIAAWGNVQANVGDIDQFGSLVMGKVNNIGPGDLNLFASAAMSRSHPSGKTYSMPFGYMDMNGNAIFDAADMQFSGDYGLLNDGTSKENHTGSAFYLGARYDVKATGTKIGLEYNHGSKYWIAFAPAADDMWASKLGTRGDVYEAYLIQEIKSKPISKLGKAFVRLGFQHYNFNYTGSNGWLGEPRKISDLNTMNPMDTQMYPTLRKANNIYLTFDVEF
ncbi:MAG: DUF3373 family protein [Nitrospirae bacterium]|nr:DUF3373 family protein [Nitrospirota bacterium]